MYEVEAHWIQITERITKDRRCERNRFGMHHTVSETEVEKCAIATISDFRQRHHSETSSLPPVILGGFDLVFEFQLLSRMYHGLRDMFANWVDVQELARLASKVPKPGLTETLKACAYGNMVTNMQSARGHHNPATDTVRTATVLAHFHRVPVGDGSLEIGTSPRNSSTLRRRRRYAAYTERQARRQMKLESLEHDAAHKLSVAVQGETA